ncbi:MAG: hypothetical protein ACE5DR_06200 [Thermodesulfobacteriota bacterium]
MKEEKLDEVMNTKRAKGVGCRFFGSVLVFTGLLGSMVSLKTGIGAGYFDYMLLISGAALLLVGSLRK